MCRLASTYDGPDMTETKPILKEGEKEHIILVHDESTINDNDYPCDFWLKADEHVLKKKVEAICKWHQVTFTSDM